MDGVAYTTGSRLDSDHKVRSRFYNLLKVGSQEGNNIPPHKEIHFSTDYIAGISPERIESEIKGVLQHELVHCFQCDGKGTCPGGLVEGMAG